MQQWIFLQLAQPLLLRVLGQMHPELENQRAAIGQGLLEGFDALQALIKIGQRAAAIDVIENRQRIPGTQEQAHAPTGRQITPEAPVFRAVTLLIGRLAKGMGDQPSRIQPFMQLIDCLALACAIHPGKHHDHRKIGLAQCHLRHQQILTQERHLFVIIGFGQLALQFGGSEHQDTRLLWRAPAATDAGRRSRRLI